MLSGGVASVNEFSKTTFEIVPNPAQDMIALQGELLAKTSQYVLRDMNGKELLRVVSKGLNSQTLNVSNFPNGTYMLDVYADEDEVLVRKRFVIAR